MLMLKDVFFGWIFVQFWVDEWMNWVFYVSFLVIFVYMIQIGEMMLLLFIFYLNIF